MRNTSCEFARAASFATKEADLDRRQLHHEALEIVVVMPLFRVVMRGASLEIVLRGGHQAEQHGGFDATLLRFDHLDGARHRAGDVAAHAHERVSINEVGFVEHDKIGAQKLILVDLLQGIFVVDGRVGGPLRASFSGSSANRPAATAAASVTAITPSTVTRARIAASRTPSEAASAGRALRSPR